MSSWSDVQGTFGTVAVCVVNNLGEELQVITVCRAIRWCQFCLSSVRDICNLMLNVSIFLFLLCLRSEQSSLLNSCLCSAKASVARDLSRGSSYGRTIGLLKFYGYIVRLCRCLDAAASCRLTRGASVLWEPIFIVSSSRCLWWDRHRCAVRKQRRRACLVCRGDIAEKIPFFSGHNLLIN